MRNLFERLDIAPDTSESLVREAIEQLPADEASFADETAAILLDEVRREQYDRVHLQYEAAAAFWRIASPDTLDTHQWRRRLVEFETE